jgi:hypothetical protein
MNLLDKDWDRVYDAGVVTGSSKERVRILNIIEEFVAEAGERAIQLRKNAAIFRDGTGNAIELNGLAEIAEYEQGAYVKVMKKINEEVDF